MKNSVVGLVLIIFAGFLHTLERIAARIGSYIAAIGHKGGYDTTPAYPTITDNIFVVISVVAGLIILLISFIQKSNKKLNI